MVDVNGNMTPWGKKVEEVTADDWPSMTVMQLMDQRLILNNRLNIAAQFGGPAMIKQIQQGIKQIDTIIKSKENVDYRKPKKPKEPTGLI